jgi:hypothetical protein
MTNEERANRAMDALKEYEDDNDFDTAVVMAEIHFEQEV